MFLPNYNPSLHEGIARAAREFKWHLDISHLQSFSLPEIANGDGIICSLSEDPEMLEFIMDSGLPTVDLSYWRSDVSLPRVVADNHKIGELAAEHFLGYGHRNFAWYASRETPFGKLRFESYRKKLVSSGFNVVRLDGPESTNTVATMQKLRALPSPTAVFTLNDFDAAWLLNRCLDANIQVPEDVAILGVDNNPLVCELQSVKISSVSRNLKKIAYEGSRLLQSFMDGAVVEPITRYIAPNGVFARASSDAMAVSDQIISQALEFMRQHLRKSIGTDDIAEAVELSKSKLEQRFKRCLQTTPRQKLIELRVNKAKSLLANTHISVEDIAAETGFCHAPHLSNVFKKYCGASPLQYRKIHETSV